MPHTVDRPQFSGLDGGWAPSSGHYYCWYFVSGCPSDPHQVPRCLAWISSLFLHGVRTFNWTGGPRIQCFPAHHQAVSGCPCRGQQSSCLPDPTSLVSNNYSSLTDCHLHCCTLQTNNQCLSLPTLKQLLPRGSPAGAGRIQAGSGTILTELQFTETQGPRSRLGGCRTHYSSTPQMSNLPCSTFNIAQLLRPQQPGLKLCPKPGWPKERRTFLQASFTYCI